MLLEKQFEEMEASKKASGPLEEVLKQMVDGDSAVLDLPHLPASVGQGECDQRADEGIACPNFGRGAVGG